MRRVDVNGKKIGSINTVTKLEVIEITFALEQFNNY